MSIRLCERCNNMYGTNPATYYDILSGIEQLRDKAARDLTGEDYDLVISTLDEAIKNLN